jgi:hypothetical protein
VPPHPFDPEKYEDIPIPERSYNYPLRESPPYLQPGSERAVRVDIRLTASQAAEIYNSVASGYLDDMQPRLSHQDALAALLAHCLSKAEPEEPPIQHISTIVLV